MESKNCKSTNDRVQNLINPFQHLFLFITPASVKRYYVMLTQYRMMDEVIRFQYHPKIYDFSFKQLFSMRRT